MDDVDATAQRAENEAPYLLAASMKPIGPEPVGSCHWCLEVFVEGSLKRFCDCTCRDAFEEERRLKRLAGK